MKPMTCKEIREENRDLNRLFQMQHKRVFHADNLWREAHPGNENVIPDLGELVEWLVKKAGLPRAK